MSPQYPQHVPSRGHDVIIACAVGPAITTMFILMRIWTRIFTRQFGWDDFAAIVTLPLCIGFSVVLGFSTQHGMGIHRYDLTPEMIADHAKWIYICSAIYLPSILGYRIAVLLLYLRLFGWNKRFKYATWLVMFFVAGYLSCNIITLLFGCTPTFKYYTPGVPGHCINFVQTDYVYGSMNVASDVIIFLLPLPVIRQLPLSPSERFGLFLVFMSGLLSIAMTTTRFALMFVNLNAADSTWLDAQTFILSVVEVNTGLICGCTPALKQFYMVIRRPTVFASDRLLLKSEDADSGSGSIWMGKGLDDQARPSHRDSIELEQGYSADNKF